MSKPRMDDLQYVRDYYGVPAYRGMKVNVYGKDGVILKGQDAYIMVLVDGEKHAKPYHPTDGVTYKVEEDSMLRGTPGDSRTSAKVAEPQLGDAITAKRMWETWPLSDKAKKATLKLRLWEAREIDEEIVKFALKFHAEAALASRRSTEEEKCAQALRDLEVVKYTIAGWARDENGRVTVHTDVISKAVDAAIYTLCDRKQYLEIAAEFNTWRTRLLPT